MQMTLRAWLLASLLVVGAQASSAAPPGPAAPAAAGASATLTPMLATQVFGPGGFTAQAGDARAAAPDAALLATGASQVPANARELAQVYPPGSRDQMQKVYGETFEVYQRLEQKLGLPQGDVAAAVAAFIVGNFMAFSGTTVEDAAFMRVVQQVRADMVAKGAVAKFAPPQKRQLYEQMAMVGTFMSLTHLAFQQNPNPAAQKNFRDSARANLELVLQAPMQGVSIDAGGLHVAAKTR